MSLSINSAILQRLALQAAAGTSHGGKRDLYDVLGYPLTTDPETFVSRFKRQDIATRIISAFPDATWSKPPELIENDDSEDLTPLETSFKDLAKKTKLWHYLKRTDKLCGLGEYSVLFIGFQDGQSDLSKPVGRARGIGYLMPFGQRDAMIQTFETNPGSHRYGLPTSYALQTGGFRGAGASSMPAQTLNVHWSRVLHVAEGLLDNDVFGTPRLESVLNRLMDLEKVVGGASEVFWINGRGGLNINADGGTPIDDPEKMKEHAESYIHQLSRILLTQGMEVKGLEMGVHEPDQHVSVLLDLISGATGIPKRILIGSERGELSSNQDENNWWSRVSERRGDFAETVILKPLIERFQGVGVLPPGDFEIKWPELVSLSEKDKATVAAQRAGAIAAYVNAAGADTIVPPSQFVEEILLMDYREDDIAAALDEEGRQMVKDEEDDLSDL